MPDCRFRHTLRGAGRDYFAYTSAVISARLDETAQRGLNTPRADADELFAIDIADSRRFYKRHADIAASIRAHDAGARTARRGLRLRCYFGDAGG